MLNKVTSIFISDTLLIPTQEICIVLNLKDTLAVGRGGLDYFWKPLGTFIGNIITNNLSFPENIYYKFCGFILKFQSKIEQGGSMELFGPRDDKSSVNHMNQHQIPNSSELEQKIKEAYPRISGLSEGGKYQILNPYEMFEDQNALRSQQCDMGCKCGVGTIGEVPKVESRIVNGYEPEIRPWMVYIKVSLIPPSK